ncbi:2-dehydropantoate 2-reductase N-terminal domain-containing protein, partial [Galactobacillus timonensis]|uniref:2-dehydropantoate 2-reductase N-terminal domain-containing protein n=1 Tax=Galactobacillus timonensis TaxID=2041840 RepID=UPI002409F35B
MKCVVLGSGSWGTALAQVLCDNANDVVLWGRNTAEVDDINVNHRNSKYFPDVEVNEKLAATNDLSAVRGADLILLAVPSSAMEAVLKETVSYLDHPVLFVNAAKGFHPTTHSLLSSYIR